MIEAERELDTNWTLTKLRANTVRGGTAIMLSQGAKFGLLLGANIILARLLTPEDFGLTAVVTSIITFFSLFNDLGLPMATIQQDEINHEQLTLLFWINTIWGCALAILTAVTAHLFARLYAEPRLGSMIILLSGGFIFIGIGSQPRALLRRQLSFIGLALIDLLSTTASIIIALVLASYGFRYWALIYMKLGAIIFAACGVWIVSGWRPGPLKLGARVRSLLVFGSHMTSFDVLSFLIRFADNLLIGWYNGPRALGFYYKAYQMLLVPTQQFSAPLGSVVIPILSRLQNETRRYGAYYHRSILLSAAFGMPMIAFLFIEADWLVPLILGNQWSESVSLFRALAPAAFIGPLDVGSGWVVVSLGRTHRQIKWGLVSSLLILSGFLLGIHWGALGVAVSFSICRVILILPKLSYSLKDSPIRWTTVLKTISHPAFASLSAAFVLFLITRYSSLTIHGLIGAGFSCSVFALLYLGCWLILPRGKSTLWSLISLIRFIR